jgi:hypothetical protein
MEDMLDTIRKGSRLFRVPGSGFRVPGSGFRVPGSGFRSNNADSTQAPLAARVFELFQILDKKIISKLWTACCAYAAFFCVLVAVCEYEFKIYIGS